MKKILMNFGIGILVTIGLSSLIVPFMLASETHNDKWLFLYAPHFIGLIYALGKAVKENV